MLCGGDGDDNLWWWWWWLSNLLKSDLHGVLMLRSTGSVRCPQLATHLEKLFWGFCPRQDCLKVLTKPFFSRRKSVWDHFEVDQGGRYWMFVERLTWELDHYFVFYLKKNGDRLSFLIYWHRRCSSSHYSLRDIHSSHPLHPKFCSETHQPIPIAF